MPAKWGHLFWEDLVERVGSTALYALITLVVSTETTPLDVHQIWPVLGLPVVLCLCKGLLANMAQPESGASLLPNPPGRHRREGV